MPFGGSKRAHVRSALHLHGRLKEAPAPAPAVPSDPDRIAPGAVMALIAMGLGVIVIANDFTALNVALTAIEGDFNVDLGTAQWVINAYCLVFGMAIVTGGRLADLFGRRRAFFIGSALFAGFSLLGGLAPNAIFLIVMRVGMGLGGALMWPAILGMTYAALPQSKAGIAGGLILGAAGLGNPAVIAMFVVAGLLLVSFAFIEPRMKKSALIPTDVVRTTEFRNACTTVTLMSAVFFVTVLYAPQFMEKILDYSALKAGVGMLPMLGTFALTSFVAGPLYGRLGPKITVTAGAVGLTVGPFLLSMVDADSGYSALIVGLALTGLGAGLFYPSVTTAGVTALDPSRPSLAGGLVYMCQIAGGAIGVAITTTIFTIISEGDLDSKATTALHGHQLTDHQVAVLHGQLAGTTAAEDALHQLPQSAQNAIVPIIKDSFAVGVQAGFRFVAIAALLGFLISLFFVGGRLLPARGAAAER